MSDTNEKTETAEVPKTVTPVGQYSAEILTDQGILAVIHGKTQEDAEANRLRIILAVNAVAGIPNDTLQKGIVQSLLALAGTTEGYLKGLINIFPDLAKPLQESLTKLLPTVTKEAPNV
jgi:hypothetical protein